MSYQFDTTTLTTEKSIKLRRDHTTSRLLVRRANRQLRRSIRAL